MPLTLPEIARIRTDATRFSGDEHWGWADGDQIYRQPEMVVAEARGAKFMRMAKGAIDDSMVPIRLADGETAAHALDDICSALGFKTSSWRDYFLALNAHGRELFEPLFARLEE